MAPRRVLTSKAPACGTTTYSCRSSRDQVIRQVNRPAPGADYPAVTALAAPACSSRKRNESRPDARRSGGSAADAKVELDRQVSLADRVPGVGDGFGFDALMQGVQIG